MDYLSRLFIQKAKWVEMIPPTSSLKEETSVTHELYGVRVSIETVGRSADSYGMSDQSGATLFYLLGKSSFDGDLSMPEFKSGDEIITETKTWTIVSVNHCQTLMGDRNHLEVRLV